jgi:hypothetical protein
MPNAETQEINDVQIRTKIPKKTKTQKDFWIFETSKGSMMCFDPSTAAKVNPSETALYNLLCEDYAPNGEHKNYTIQKNGLLKVTEGAPRPVTPASGPAQGPWTAPRSGGPGSGMNGDLARDTRISKLSVFTAIIQLQTAKMKVDPEYAKLSTAVLACDAIDLTNAVVAELIYPENAAKPAAAPAAAAETGPISDEPPFKQPAQPAAQPASQPASQQMPPVTPPPAPAQPAYIPPPVQVATPPQPPAQPPVMMQAPADKQAQAKALFGVKTDMESAMAARVAKMLGKPAPAAQ